MDLQSASALIHAEVARFPEARGWVISWTRSQKNLGETQWDRHVIALSKPYVIRAAPEEVLNTIRHELAHVLAGWAGTKQKPGGHGDLWLAACSVTGSSTEICGSARYGLGPSWKGYCECRTGWGPLVRRRTKPPSSEAFCRKCASAIWWE